MKFQYTVVVAIAALAASPVFAQGKGGGNSGNGKGGGAPGPSLSPPAGSRPNRIDPESNRRNEMPNTDAASKPSDHSKGKGKGKGKGSAANAGQGLAASMHDINQTSFAQRRELHANLDLSLKSSRDQLKQIQAEAKNLRADARADFKTALDDVKRRENELVRAVKESKKADEAGWNNHREALSRAYQNHTDALARLKAIPVPPRP